MAETARKGKIATLPAKIREEVNRRLHEGQQAKEILAWLNADKDVLRILDEKWHEQPVTAQNLSEWRQGGYQDWLDKNEKVESIKVLSDYSFKLAEAAGGSLSKGSVAVAGGRILSLLENAQDAELKDLIDSLTALRHAEVESEKEQGKQIDRAQRAEIIALEKQKFQRQTAEYFMKFYEDRRAKEIAEGKGSKELKMDQLVTLMFGEKPTAAGSSNEGGEPG